MTVEPLTENASLEALVAQVVDEFLERQRRGERPDPSEYAARHPQAAAVLREVLAALHVVGLSSVAGVALAGNGLAGEDAVTGTLGDFRLLREVGRGGMGVVYEAEQISLGRRVALKVLPFAAALDARQLQRFKNEAQAAAHLQHTHIVPVYFVGSERGVHFYAMQFIDGRPLSAVIRELRRLAGLDESEPQPSEPRLSGSGSASPLPDGRGSETTAPLGALTTERSLRGPEYFRTVAQLGVQAATALEHAHQQGVIHRDIKPANLLLEWRAGGVNPPVLWVADFGLAQFQKDAGLTLSGDLLGTLRYMSPEQALGRRAWTDHRTDVYSLGATLYELLTLEPAVDGVERGEVLRRIEHEEPVPPRRVNAAVPAELETVVLKALAKEPAERYATAQELADDLERFLKHEPIRARRPGMGQRLRKWSRRHRGVLATALAVSALALLGLVLGLFWHNRQLGQAAERERDLSTKAKGEAERARAVIKYLLEDLLGQAAPEKNARQKKVTVEEVLDKAAANVDKGFPGRPDLEAAVRLAIGQTYQQLGLFERAQPQLERALALRKECLGPEDPETLTAVDSLGSLLRDRGRLAEAEPLLRQNLDALRRVQGPDDPLTLRAVDSLALVLMDQDKLAEAGPLWHQNLEARRRVLGPDHSDTLDAVNSVGMVLIIQGKLTEAEPLLRQNLEACRRVLGLDHFGTLTVESNLASVLHNQGKLTEAESLLRQNLEACRQVLTPDHSLTLLAVNNLAMLLRDQGKLTEAEPLLRQNLEDRKHVLGPHHADTLQAVNNLALVLMNQGKLAEAEPLFRQNLQACRQVLRPDHSLTLTVVNNLGRLLRDQGELTEAEPLLRQSLEARRRVLRPDHPDTLLAVSNLAMLLRDQGKLAEAEPLFREDLETCRRVLGPDHPDTLMALNNLAALCWSKKELDRSIPMFEEVLERRKTQLGAENPHTLSTMANLGVNYRDAGRLSEALPLLEEAHRHRHRHPELAWVGSRLLAAYTQAGKSAEAVALVPQLIASARKRYPPGSLQLASELATGGWSLSRAKAFADAEPILRECLAIRQDKQPDAWTTFDTQSLLGACLAAQKQYAEAEPLLLAGYRDLEKATGTPPAERARACERLVQLYEAWGKPDEAAKWQKVLEARQAKEKQ